MTARAEYTEAEWMLLATTPFVVGFAVAFSDGQGLIETLRETGALVAAQTSALDEYAGNELVLSLTKNQAAVRREGEQRTRGLAQDPAGAPAGFSEAAVANCRAAAALLADRSDPREADGYKRYVMDMARSVAAATRGGGLFSRAPLVGEAELALLEAVAEAFGIPVGELPPDGHEGAATGEAAPPRVAGPPRPDTVRGFPGIPAGPIQPA